MTIEQIKDFMDWYEENPTFRQVNITLKSDNPSVFVYDRTMGTGQLVNDVSEIDLIAKMQKDVKRSADRLRSYGYDFLVKEDLT